MVNPPFYRDFLPHQRHFVTIATAKKGEVKIKYKAGSLTVGSPLVSLTKKELKRVFGTPIYMFNCALGAVMQVIIGGVVFLKVPELLVKVTEQMPDFHVNTIAIPVLCMALSFCALFTTTSSVSLSLEGKHFLALCSLPLSTHSILGSKILANLVIGLPPVVFPWICCCLAVPMTAIQSALFLFVSMIVPIFVALFGMTANLWLPRFDWISEAAVVKNSGSALVTVFGSMAVLAVPCLVFITHLGKAVSFELFTSVAALLLALISIFLYFYSMKLGKIRIEKM